MSPRPLPPKLDRPRWRGMPQLLSLWVLLALGLVASVSDGCTDGKANGEGSEVQDQRTEVERLLAVDTAAIVAEARERLSAAPVTVTDFAADRSAGDIHDYYSEGRYWWPDEDNPDGPYVQRDGVSNPNLFTAHREAVDEFTDDVAQLTTAYLVTGEESFAAKAEEHLRAWFVTPETRMNPSLMYAQAIKGRNQGRGIGIIDTRSFIYVAAAFEQLAKHQQLDAEVETGVQRWFDEYITWLTTHEQGLDERDHGNNHSTWWGAQVAAFARAADREDLLDTARQQYKRQLSLQLDSTLTFHDEVARTRPGHYVEYVLDGFASLAHITQTPNQSLWDYESDHGTLEEAMDAYLEYVNEPDSWPYRTELETELHATAADYLFLAALDLDSQRYAKQWRSLYADDYPLDIAARLFVFTAR